MWGWPLFSVFCRLQISGELLRRSSLAGRATADLSPQLSSLSAHAQLTIRRTFDIGSAVLFCPRFLGRLMAPRNIRPDYHLNEVEVVEHTTSSNPRLGGAPKLNQRGIHPSCLLLTNLSAARISIYATEAALGRL